MVEAICINLKNKFPQITEVILQSDNASCYQNSMLLLVLPIFKYVYGITISRYHRLLFHLIFSNNSLQICGIQ